MATDVELERAQTLAEARANPAPQDSENQTPSAPVEQDIGREWTSFQRRYLGVQESDPGRARGAEDYKIQRQEHVMQLNYMRAQRAKYRGLKELAKKHRRPSFFLWILVLVIIAAFDIWQIVLVVGEIIAAATGAGAPVAAAADGADDAIELIPGALMLLLNWYFGKKYKHYQELQSAMQEGEAMAAKENAILETYEQTRLVIAQFEQAQKQKEEQGKTGGAEKGEKIETPETGQTSPHAQYRAAKLRAAAAGMRAYHGVKAIAKFAENPWGFFKMLIFWGIDETPIAKIIPFKTYATFMAGYRCHQTFHQVLEQWEKYQKSELANM